MEIPSTFARRSSSYSLLSSTYLMGECSNFVTILADEGCKGYLPSLLTWINSRMPLSTN
jgi:hypothetical protein